MKRVLLTIIVTVNLCFTVTAIAGDENYMITRMWDRQKEGIEGVIQCFKNDCSPIGYKEHLLKIVSAESSLISYGVSPKDKRLVSHLATDVRSMSDFPIFAYRLFKKRLYEMTGFVPSPDGPFRGQLMKIVPKKNTGMAGPVELIF